MNVFEAVKQSVTTRQAAEFYGFRVNRAGMIACPFHNDRTPSMKVDKRFHCFGCGADGDAVDFVSRLFELPSKEAAMKLADDFGIAYDRNGKPSIVAKIREPTAKQKFEAEEKRCFRVLSDYFHKLRAWEKDYAPKQPEDEWHPLFTEALNKRDYIEYLLDILIDGTLEDRKALVSSIFPTLGSGLANALSGTSYASEDTDLLGVDEDYTALENELAQTVANIESTHPGYDEYRYSVDEIGHNPYELASYLSAKYHVYFREQVQDELREIFEAQYELTLTEEVEIRYRTETSTDPETGETTTEEVPYEYYILNVTITNKTLPAVILPRLNEQQREIYTVMQQLKGNKPYLWEGIYNGGEDTGPSYEIPGEALDDPAFAALMEEATKYIGWPYVWGGSSPSTSFDCSGFVCWVYTASGVHNLPRTTAQGIYNQCAIISPSEAKPGDIIFFTGTYDSPGPVSHVGIYVGDGMMLHCGSPIQYANINSSYWQTHFYAFGRL